MLRMLFLAIDAKRFISVWLKLNFYFDTGKHVEFGLPAIVSSGSIDKTSAARIHHSHIALDICAII